MIFYHLSKQHLADPYHTPPSGIAHKRPHNLIGQFRKACPIGQPWSPFEYVVYFSLYLV